MQWIVGKLKWLFFIAALAGPVFAYLSWEDARRIDRVKADGIEVAADIQSMTKRTGRKRISTYAVDLSWTDQSGEKRTASGIPISTSLATKSIENDELTVATFPIKYLPGEPNIKPILIPDIAEQEDQNAFMIKFAGIGGVLGIIGSFLFLLFGRAKAE